MATALAVYICKHLYGVFKYETSISKLMCISNRHCLEEGREYADIHQGALVSFIVYSVHPIMSPYTRRFQLLIIKV